MKLSGACLCEGCGEFRLRLVCQGFFGYLVRKQIPSWCSLLLAKSPFVEYNVTIMTRNHPGNHPDFVLTTISNVDIEF